MEQELYKKFSDTKKEKIYFIDLFAGAGGTSSGIHRVSIPNKAVKVIACINHDKNAIISHEANHPDCLHYIEDIRTIDLHPILEMVQNIRQNDMFAKICIWASLECTNFSKAKGGKPRDADSRTLADHLFRYLDTFNPDFLFIENVSEFMAWGDLCENGKPISMEKGKSYLEWVDKVKNYGFEYEHRILNSADYGVPQSRKRLFIQFARNINHIKWPEPTHSKDGVFLPKWKAVKNCLDLEDVGRSIFEGKPRSEKTLERIYHGIIKFVAGGEKNFIVKWNSWSKSGKYVPPSVNDPSPTITTQNRLGVCTAFTSLYYSGSPESKNKSIEEPASSITTIDHHSLVQPQFLQKYYGKGKNIDSLENPSPTITTKDRVSLISSNFVYRDFSNSGYLGSLENPSGAVLTNPKLNLVTPEYILNPQWGTNCSKSLENPSPTIIARQDKTPLYLVSVEHGFSLPLFESDSEWTRKLKETMIVLGIVDIKMRMFKVKELLKIQDFPEDYILVGTEAEKKKYIGNAVPVGVVHKLIEKIFS